jgi:7-cyano-7-deazaguanine synthase in queuosine biosynthesis
MSRVVLLNSGGIDSRVAAAMLVVSGMEVHSLTIDWNPGARERVLRAARLTADSYCASHFEFAYSVDWMTWSDKLGRVRMPFAVLAAVALGAQYAVTLGPDVTWLATGRRYQSVEVPGSSTEEMNRVLTQSRLSQTLVLLNPVFDFSDSRVDEKAAELGVDLTTTVSCLAAEECGTCVSCQRRRRFGL